MVEMMKTRMLEKSSNLTVRSFEHGVAGPELAQRGNINLCKSANFVDLPPGDGYPTE